MNIDIQNNEILIAEALHEREIASIADKIKKRKSTKVVLISGPSSAGKTTFSKRISIQLQVLGFETVEISLDNYFVDREFTPKDENGEYNFEALEALDIDFFNEQLSALLRKKEIEMPTFDFRTGKRAFRGNKIKITSKTILIIEGIHALNPTLTKKIARKLKYNIFCFVKNTDNRILRRIVRDYSYRGYSAADTISRWESVRRGENKYIFPYQKYADIMFDSSLTFETKVIKELAEPLLLEGSPKAQETPKAQEVPGAQEARRLLEFLSHFQPMDATPIPPTSILREFIGGSSFIY